MVSNISIDNNSNSFIERVAKENIWPIPYTIRVIEEYKKFIWLASKYDVSPSYEIDQVWHTHLLYTKDYKKMCDEVLNVEIHHNPFSKTQEKMLGKDLYKQTKQHYRLIFGYEPPEDIWTVWKNSNYVKIDINNHWVVPVGDIKALFVIIIKQIKSKFYGLFKLALWKKEK